MIDLNNGGKEDSYGLLAPNTKYYVHAYRDGSKIASPGAVTTEDYPASLPDPITSEPSSSNSNADDNHLRAMWGMNAWRRRSDGTDLSIDDELLSSSPKALKIRTLEYRPGEVMYLPFRSIPMFPPKVTPPTQASSCNVAASIVATQYYFSDGTTLSSPVISYSSPVEFLNGGTTESAGASVLFRGKFTATYYDLMSIVNTADFRGRSLSYVYFVDNCANGSNSNFYRYGFDLNVVGE